MSNYGAYPKGWVMISSRIGKTRGVRISDSFTERYKQKPPLNSTIPTMPPHLQDVASQDLIDAVNALCI